MARGNPSIPQDAGDLKDTIVHKTEGKPLPQKAREVVAETGREVSGDYERRQEEHAATSPPRRARPKRTTS